jgi:hypothetical protein
MSKEIEYLQEKGINHWGLGADYAESKHPMIIGVSTLEDFEKGDVLKTAYEQGVLDLTTLLLEKKLL